MTTLDLPPIQTLLISIAYEAGTLMLSPASSSSISSLDPSTKLNSVDLVTQVDQAVEAMVSKRLKEAYPDIKFMGEETYKPGMRVGEEPTFIVDPIDGTTNFVHGIPSFCISLGLSINRTPHIGVIYNPTLDILFFATRGSGAYMTQGRNSSPQKLPLSPQPRPLTGLGASVVAVEYGSDRTGNNYKLKTEVFTKLGAAREDGGSMVHSLRSWGSAALNIAAVAAGWMDAYWEGGCWAWDVCAGWCILEEAGGKMVSGNPGGWETELESRVYLAVRGAPEGQKELVEEFWGVIGEGRLEYSV